MHPATHGFSVPVSSSAEAPSTTDGSSACVNEPKTATDGAREKAQRFDPDLVRIMAAWPSLSEPIRRAMLVLVG
jgi:hypothetical protein